MTTILTAPTPPEIQAKLDAFSMEEARLRDIAQEIWLGCYADGYLTFEQMCDRAAQTLAPLDEGLRNATLGRVVFEALRIAPAKVKARNKGEAPRFQEACLGMLHQLKKHEGWPATVPVDGTSQTLFERGSRILRGLGADVTAPQLKRWYYGKNKRAG
jgi:hypothetical protein